MKTFCCTSVPSINPLRLAADFRDCWGDAHARLVELTDPIILSGCFEPRIYHAPDLATENFGISPAQDYIQYMLDIPAGSFILGFLHHATGLTNSNVATCPPTMSTFRMQITDVARNYQLFQKPIPEAWFLNDSPSMNPSGPYAASSTGNLYELNPSPRLLCAPYPVAPPGKIKVEFWNSLQSAGQNTLVQMTFLVAVPAGAPESGGAPSGS